jgi:hypothetical protein
MGEVLSPRCPLCSSPPVIMLGGGTQAFCGDDDCPTLTWNPMESPEEFRRTARPVEIVESGPGEGHYTP